MHVKLPSITKECFSELSTACDPCGFHASTPTIASVGRLELKCFTSKELKSGNQSMHDWELGHSQLHVAAQNPPDSISG